MNTINIPNDEKFRIRDSALLHYIGNEDIVFVCTDLSLFTDVLDSPFDEFFTLEHCESLEDDGGRR